MSEQDSKPPKLEADEIHTEHIVSTLDEEVIRIGADLIPDDIDMYPRLIGSREMPFREVVAERLCGCIDPREERDCIGAGMPFDSIRAKYIYGNLHGPINGMAFPGTIAGYGWILVLANTAPDGISARIQRALWPAKHFSLIRQDAQNPHILVHPGSPFIPFIVANPVFAEFVINDIQSSSTSVYTRSLVPKLNAALKLPEIDIEIELPQNVSGQYQILIRLY